MLKLSKGFTIIELIVVIAIIAVLATIVMINISGYTQKARLAKIAGDLHTLINNSSLFYAQNKHYGDQSSGISFCGSNDAQNTMDSIDNIAGGGQFNAYCHDPSMYNCGPDNFIFYVQNYVGHSWVSVYCADSNGVYNNITVTGQMSYEWCACHDPATTE